MSDHPVDPEGVVRALFDAYRTEDRQAAEPLVADELSFTSPQDDHIDRAAWFTRCFPTASRMRRQDMLYVTRVSEADVFVMYEYELLDGTVHRNTEVNTVRDGQVVEVQVFFGGRVS